MKRTKRSIWHDRPIAGNRGRPRSCPQWLWHFATPDRACDVYRYHGRATGWRGGRDRNTPRKQFWSLFVRGERIGSVMRYEHNGRWSACLVEGGCVTVGTNAHFGRRCDAKRWVESARRSRR